MKARTALLIVTAALALTRCMPATAGASTKANLLDSVTCTSTTLSSMGYDVLAADVHDGLVQGQRLKHVSNPRSGAMDADRITVFLDEGHFRVLGETVGSATAIRVPGRTRRIGGVSDGPARDLGMVRKWTSREVAADTQTLALTCGE
jgi:hypothetical protein